MFFIVTYCRASSQRGHNFTIIAYCVVGIEIIKEVAFDIEEIVKYYQFFKIMKKIILLIVLLATFLVVIWYRDGLIMGTAEDNLLFYDVSHFLSESQFAWMEHPGLGRVTINLTAARPTYEALTFLHKAGVQNFLIQAIVLWLILVSAGLGVYLTVKEFFPKLQDKYILLSVLFYWFNPLSLVDVWNRFLSNYLFSFGLLPIATYLFVRGLSRKNYFWAFVLVLVLPIYGFAFTYLAFDILLWMYLSFITFLFTLTRWRLTARLFYIKFFLLTLFLFLVTNCWWIGQVFSLNLYKNIYSSVLNFNASDNLSTLEALSGKMGNLSDIFRFINASFINERSLLWVKILNSFPFMVLQYLIIIVVLYSIVRYIKNRSVFVLGALVLISIFLAKGTNPPFGDLYKYLFSKILLLQVFRNPFEKASFILSLSVSLLVGFSLSHLTSEMPRKLGGLIYIGFLGFIILIWGFPFYTGLVFTSPEPPANDYKIGYKVQVPAYYKTADQWLSNHEGNFRFVGFPLGGEGITYNWVKGYAGVELSSAFFANPGILYSTAVPYFNTLVPAIQQTLMSGGDFIGLADALNARFFFVRHDIDFIRRQMEDPTNIENNFLNREKSGEIRKVATFGQLTFWENLDWKDRTFYAADKIIKTTDASQVSEALDFNINNGEATAYLDNAAPLKLENGSILSYRKINPARYIVHIKNSAPFVLVFSELFNDAWQANYQGDILKHFRANYYANGWLIDKTGDFELTIEYLPQRLLESSEKISVFSYLAVAIIAISLTLKAIRKKKK